MSLPTRQGIRYLALAVVGAVLATVLGLLLTLSSTPETHSQGQEDGPTPTPTPTLTPKEREFLELVKEWDKYLDPPGVVGQSGGSSSDCDEDDIPSQWYSVLYDFDKEALKVTPKSIWGFIPGDGTTVPVSANFQLLRNGVVVNSQSHSNVPAFATFYGTAITNLELGSRYTLRYWPSYTRAGQTHCGPVKATSFNTPPKPRVAISTAQDTVTEGVSVQFTVTANPAPRSDLTVAVSVTESGSYIRGTPPSSVTIGKGQNFASFPVNTIDDSIDEADGSVTATLQEATNGKYDLSNLSSKRVTVRDNDLPPTDPDPGPGPDAHADTDAYSEAPGTKAAGPEAAGAGAGAGAVGGEGCQPAQHGDRGLPLGAGELERGGRCPRLPGGAAAERKHDVDGARSHHGHRH